MSLESKESGSQTRVPLRPASPADSFLYLCPFLQWPCAFPCAARHASPEMATVSSRTITFRCNAFTACCYRPLHSAAKPAARGPRGAPHGIRNHLPRLLPSGAPGGSWDSTFSSRAAGSLSWPDPSTPSAGPGACTTKWHAAYSLAPISSQLSPRSDRPGVTLATRPFPVTAPPRAEVNTPALRANQNGPFL